MTLLLSTEIPLASPKELLEDTPSYYEKKQKRKNLSLRCFCLCLLLSTKKQVVLSYPAKKVTFDY